MWEYGDVDKSLDHTEREVDAIHILLQTATYLLRTSTGHAMLSALTDTRAACLSQKIK